MADTLARKRRGRAHGNVRRVSCCVCATPTGTRVRRVPAGAPN